MSSRRLVTLGVLGGAFLAAIEATIVSTVMPTVVDHLGGLSHYAWVFSAYILTSTVTMPLWGRLSDLYGRRTFYLALGRDVPARLGALGRVAVDGPADRLPRRPGHRRRRPAAARHDDHRRALHAEGARPRAGVVQRRVGAGVDRRSAGRRLHRRSHVVALGVLSESAVRRDCRGAGRDVAGRSAQPRAAAHRLSRRGGAERRHHAVPARADADRLARRRARQRDADHRSTRSARGSASGSCASSGACRSRSCRCRCCRTPTWGAPRSWAS